MLICDKCEAQILDGSKFCPQCADPVDQKDSVGNDLNFNKEPSAVLEFGYSRSLNYQRALTLCEDMPSYSCKGSDKSIRHRLELSLRDVELIITIFDLVGSWNSSSMMINGLRASKADLVYHGAGCYRERQKVSNPRQYCYGNSRWEFNVWGCRKLEMPLVEFAPWLDFGSFDQEGVWHLDKERIRDNLEDRLKKNQFCPILNEQKVMETWSKLPETIDPKKDHMWAYRTTYENIDGEYRQIVVGIKPKMIDATEYVTGDFKPTFEFDEEETTKNENEIPISITQELGSVPLVSPSIWRKLFNVFK